MHYVVKAKKVTIGENVLMVKPLTRLAANDFRAKSAAAGDDFAEQEELAAEVVRTNVTFEDGSAVDPGEMPALDLVQLLKVCIGVDDGKSLSDFTVKH
jgi:hypothetical protein